MRNRLVVKGARQNNLRDVSVELPRDTLIVFSGVSGSGKSSLAFDTIFAEGQRRYIESLSAYARQFLGQIDKPDVDAVEGLSPAIAIDQKTSSRNPRSTVGTITEVYDHLRLLYARIGHPHCPECGEPVSRQTPQRIVDLLLDEDEGTRFQVLAPVVRGRKGEHVEIFRQLSADGFSRVRVDGTVLALTTPPALDKRKKHSIDAVIDRLTVKPGIRQRLTESVETALGVGCGVLRVEFMDQKLGSAGRELVLSEEMACPRYHNIGLESLEPRLFSFNAPWGACPTCTGLGSHMEVDPALVVPDDTMSLAEGAIAPWTNTSGADYYARLLEALGADVGFSVTTPGVSFPPVYVRWCCTVRSGGCTSRTGTASDVTARTWPALKVSSRISSAAMPRAPSPQPVRTGSPGTCARSRVQLAGARGSPREFSRSRSAGAASLRRPPCH